MALACTCWEERETMRRLMSPPTLSRHRPLPFTPHFLSLSPPLLALQWRTLSRVVPLPSSPTATPCNTGGWPARHDNALTSCRLSGTPPPSTPGCSQRPLTHRQRSCRSVWLRREARLRCGGARKKCDYGSHARSRVFLPPCEGFLPLLRGA